MIWKKWGKVISSAVLFIVFIILPLVMTNLYQVGVVITMLINVLLAASLWLVITTGQVSLGHGAFAAIGGFMSAAMVTAYGMNSWVSLLIAVITSGITGLILGYITLRIKGVYFIIATLALGGFIGIVFGMWDHPFGGLHGIMNIPNPDPIIINGLGGIYFRSNVETYYLTLVFVALGIVVIHRVYSGPIGRVFQSISQADELAENVGINIMRYKVLAFVIACTLAGLAGVLSVYSTQYISPTSYTIIQSAYYLLCIAVGGGGSIAGPVIGAIFLGLFSELIRPVQEFQPIVFGLLLVICVLFFKYGLLGAAQKVWQLFAARLLTSGKASDTA